MRELKLYFSRNPIETIDFPDYPSIKALVCFEDINGEKLEQLFTLELQLFNIGPTGEDKTQSISGNIEIKEETV